jgi:hypothetical protein
VVADFQTNSISTARIKLGHVEINFRVLTNGFGGLLGRGRPLDGAEVLRQGEKAVVLARVGPHLDQTAASHHVVQTIGR